MNGFETMDFFFVKLALWLVLGVALLTATAKQKDWLWNGLPINVSLMAIALWPATTLLLIAARIERQRVSK